jgi:hypothetical protein
LGKRVSVLRLLIPALAFVGCSEDEMAPTSSSSNPTAEPILSTNQYVSDMQELLDRTDTLIKDLIDLLGVWNATKNKSYAAANAATLLVKAQAILTSAQQLRPTQRYRESHDTFTQMILAVVSSLQSMGIYFITQNESMSESALLGANVKLREFDRLREVYNEQIQA